MANSQEMQDSHESGAYDYRPPYSQPYLESFGAIHEVLNYTTAVLWFMAYVALLRKLQKERSALGLSLQSLTALVFVEVNNLLLILTLTWYYGRSINLDFYLVDCTTVAISVSTLIYVSVKFASSYERQQDTFGKQVCYMCCIRPLAEKYYFFSLYLICAIIAIPLFWLRRSSLPLFLSFWECYDDTVLALALLPQLHMFYNKRPRKINNLLGQFVIYLLLARVFALLYWISFPWFHSRQPAGRGLHIATELLNIAILGDFAFHYVKAKLKGAKDITLPV